MVPIDQIDRGLSGLSGLAASQALMGTNATINITLTLSVSLTHAQSACVNSMHIHCMNTGHVPGESASRPAQFRSAVAQLHHVKACRRTRPITSCPSESSYVTARLSDRNFRKMPISRSPRLASLCAPFPRFNGVDMDKVPE